MAESDQSKQGGFLGRTLQRLQFGTAVAVTACLAYPFWIAVTIQEKITGRPFWVGSLLDREHYDDAHPIIIPRKQQPRQEAPNQPFRFLDLPEELQIDIIEYALGPWDAHGLHQEYNQFQFEGSDNVGMGYVIFGYPRPIAMSLLLTSRLVHEFASDALSKTFTGHLSLMNPRRKSSDLDEWLRVDIRHPTFLNYRWIFQRVTTVRTDTASIPIAWSRLPLPVKLPHIRDPEIDVLPNLRRIECDLTQTRLPRLVWGQDDLRKFRNGQYNNKLIEEGRVLADLELRPGSLASLEGTELEFLVTYNAAISDRLTRHRIAVVQIRLCPEPSLIMKRVIKTADGTVEWEEIEAENVHFHKSRAGEIDTNWHLYDLWDQRRD